MQQYARRALRRGFGDRFGPFALERTLGALQQVRPGFLVASQGFQVASDSTGSGLSAVAVDFGDGFRRSAKHDFFGNLAAPMPEDDAVNRLVAERLAIGCGE